VTISIELSAAVSDALASGTAVVALESTVYSNLGLPSPDNAAALQRSVDAVTAAGAVPAVTAVVNGRARAGIESDEWESILTATRKTAERDLPVAIGQRWPVGVTTVSASLAIAAAAGIRVFATGGIGGVHRESSLTGDISADLGAIARHPVATVSAGAKSFLDLPMTLEALETLGAPVIGWETNEFPAFTARTSGIALSHRCADIAELGRILDAQCSLGRGMLVVTPVPAVDALEQELHDTALADALLAAAAEGVVGAAVTPFVLGRIAAATDGASIPANLALVENNARLAARLAVEQAA
jgi:pseudouridine-5'-phosphate glycosidase